MTNTQLDFEVDKDFVSDTEELKKEAGLSTEEELLNLKIKTLLSKDKPKFQSLGMGLHNEVFYYGTKIYDEDFKPHDAIVTSDKKVYVNWGNNDEIKTKFGLNYKWEFFDDILDRHWSNQSIKKWLFGKTNKISIQKAFNKIVKKNQLYMIYPDERWHKVVALDILSSYFTELFECKGRTLISQDKGSGKTRQSTIYKLLSFNSAMSNDWSKSSIFRSIESTKATIIIDNFDEISDEVRKDIMVVYRAYKKSKSVRTEGESKRKPMGFDLFTSILLNNILGLDDTSEDRARKLPIIKSKDPIVNRKMNEKDSEWQEIRDECYVCGLQNWELVYKTYRKMKEQRLIGRELEIIEDILTLAKLISKKLYEEILGLYQEQLEQNKIKELSDDWIYLGTESILEKLKSERCLEKWINVADIVEDVSTALWNPDIRDLNQKKRSLAIFLGKVFKNIPLFKGRTVNGRVQYLFKKDNVLRFCDLKDYRNLIESYSTYSTLSTYSTNPTKSTKQVESVDSVERKEGSE